MAYDPTLPADGSLATAAELRGQFTALKTLVDARPTSAQVNDAILADAAGSCDGVSNISPTLSNPPTQAELQMLADKLSELIDALRRA